MQAQQELGTAVLVYFKLDLLLRIPICASFKVVHTLLGVDFPGSERPLHRLLARFWQQPR